MVMGVKVVIAGGPWSSSWAAKRTAGPLEDAGDVEDHRPVGVDGFEVGEAQVGLGLVGDIMPVGLLGVDGVLQVAGGGQDAGVDDEGVAVGLGGLVVVVGGPDSAPVGKED
jgi:hypothetical protein